MALNISLRGGFAKTRPPILLQTLDYGGDTTLQALVETGYFQGAGYYRPDYGTELLIACISGHILQFTPNGTTWTVTDISIPGDLLSATVYQIWMWQSEKWMIIADGSGSLPIFFDGVSCRRSYGPSIILGIVTAASSAAPPAIGDPVVVTLQATYEGPFNVPVLFNGEYYETSSGTSNALLTNVNDVPGNVVPSGTPVIVNPSSVGITSSTAISSSGGSLGGGCVIGGFHSYCWTNYLFTVTLPMLSVGPVSFGTSILVPTTNNGTQTYSVQSFTSTSIIATRTAQGLLQPCGACVTVPAPSSDNIASGALIQYASGPGPNYIIGTLTDDFTVPAVGSSVAVTMDSAFSGTNGTVVTVGGATYNISSIDPIGGTSLALINLSDTSTNNYTFVQDLLSVPELPACRMGAYGMGRNWLSLTDGISYIAGDIVGGPAGTVANNYRDSVLKTTENDFLSGGGTFRLPGSGDIITAMLFPPILDSSLGQGELEIGTAFSMFSNNSPVDRSTWTTLTSPLQTESLKDNGPLGQNSTILVNSDTFFRSNVGIGSLVLARREFYDWGNKPVSNELQRVLSLDTVSLLQYGSAASFDNRYLCTCSPQVVGQGVFHAGFVVLNFDLLSSLRGTIPPAWEGAWSGINSLQIVRGRVSGLDRCFSFTYDNINKKTQLHELLSEAESLSQGIFDDNNETRIISFFETAVLFNKDVKPMTDNIRLNNGEISLSNIRGQVDVTVKYRPLYYPCWVDWHSFTVCADESAQNSQPQYRYRLGLGTPNGTDCDSSTKLPLREGLAFQFRVEITGSCTFQDMKVEAIEIPNPKFAPMVCDATEAVLADCPSLVCTVTPDLEIYSTQSLPPPAAQPTAPVSANFTNTAQYISNLCASGFPAYSGNTPQWISLDADNNRFIIAAGYFIGETQADANASALSAGTTFVASIKASGALTCPCAGVAMEPADMSWSVAYTGATGFITSASGDTISFNIPSGTLGNVWAHCSAQICNPTFSDFTIRLTPTITDYSVATVSTSDVYVTYTQRGSLGWPQADSPFVRSKSGGWPYGPQTHDYLIPAGTTQTIDVYIGVDASGPDAHMIGNVVFTKI